MESWGELLEDLEQKQRDNQLNKEGEKNIMFIKYVAIPNRINFNKWAQNWIIVREFPYWFESTEDATPSVRIITEKFTMLPKAYDTFFVAAFPEIFLWLQNELRTDKDLINLFDQYEVNRDAYLDERDKFSVTFCIKLCNLFLQKGNRFELSDAG